MGSEIVTSSSTSHQRVIRSIASSFGDVDKLSKQITSEKKYDAFSEIEPHSLRVLQDLSNEIVISEKKIDFNLLLSRRINEYEETVKSLQGVLDKALNFIQIANDPFNGKSLPVREISEQYLSEIKGFLTKTFEGRYIFSGSRTDTNPIAEIANISNVKDDGTITANYYRGDDNKLVQQISENQSIDFTITADDPTFQKFIAAFHYAKKFSVTGSKTDIAKANNLLQEVKDGLRGFTAVLGSYSETVERAISDSRNAVYSKKELLSSIKDTDIPTATTELAMKTAKLHGLFLLSAKSAEMFIVNYLK